MTGETPAASGGLFESLRSLTVSVVGIVHTRLELLSNDFAEHGQHFVMLLVLILSALFCLGMGLLLISILIVVAVWESHPLLALGGLAAFFLAISAAAVWYAVQKVRSRPRLFEASLTELARDRQHLGS